MIMCYITTEINKKTTLPIRIFKFGNTINKNKGFQFIDNPTI